MIVAMAWLKGGSIPGARRMIREAFQRGRKAAWLPAADWEGLLSQPLEYVRSVLSLGDVPDYEELRSSEGKKALDASVG